MQSINLQITPNGVLPKVYASQFDVGREIQFNLYDGATAYIPPVGTQIRFEGKKSDGNGFSYNCTYTDNVVTVVLTDQMTVFAEEVPCELRLADYSGDIGTLNVILAVEKSPIDENTPMSDTEIPAIIELARTEQYNAEAWAEGTRNGVPVDPDDPTYNNNAKYYAEHSSASMANLSDTDIQSLSDGQIVKYDSVSGKWKNVDDNLDDVNDVDITSPTDGDALIYNGNSGKWVNGQGGSGSSTLAGLTDVNLTTPTNNQVLKYDSANQEWINGDAPSGGSGGSTVTITTAESALYGETVTITDGVDTFTGTFDNVGNCEIQGVTITGSATVSATGGGQTATASLTMPYFGNYSTTLAFFSATVNVTFPYANGASCTLSDGVTTLTANTSPMAFTVPNTGTWTATVTLDGVAKTESFVITTDGQTESHTFEYGTINLTYANEFRGLTISCVNGGTTIQKTAPVGVNSMVFYPPSTGTWTISGTYSGIPYTTTATVSSLSTAVSAVLQTIPNGSTVTPTDVIQTWLKCAGIFNKNYTTIGQVLSDSTTLLALISDNNAVDYMVRSTTWASSVCANSTAMSDIGANDYCATTLLANSTWCTAICNSTYFESVLNKKVPTMTSNTAPSGVCFGDHKYTGDYYMPFDGSGTSSYLYAAADDSGVGYQFTSSNKCKKVVMTLGLKVMGAMYQRADTIKIQANNGGDTWTTLKTDTSHGEESGTKTYTYILTNDAAYTRYRLLLDNNNEGYGCPYVYTLQFYGR